MVRRLWRGALLWGGVFALTVWALVSQFAREYPTAADRARLVATMGSDVGSQAIFGPAHHLARAPAAPVRWQSAAILVAIGLVAAAIGAIAFARRDLKGA
jgi:ABC-2 type transport system permease protein